MIIPLAPRTARAIDLATGERRDGAMFLGADGQRLDRPPRHLIIVSFLAGAARSSAQLTSLPNAVSDSRPSSVPKQTNCHET